MNTLENKLIKISEDIELGRKQRAADKLRKLVQRHPENMDIWFMTGELYYNAGFLDMAGRYWLIYPSVESYIVDTVEGYKRSVNHSATQMLRDIKFRGDAEKLPLYSKRLLTELEREAYRTTGFVPRYTGIPYTPEKKMSLSDEWGVNVRPGCLIGGMIILFLLASLIVGAVTIVGLLF